MKLKVKRKDQGCDDRNKEAAQGATNRRCEIVSGQMVWLRSQSIEFTMAAHAAAEEAHTVGDDLRQ